MWHARVFGLCGIAEKVSEDATTTLQLAVFSALSSLQLSHYDERAFYGPSQAVHRLVCVRLFHRT